MISAEVLTVTCGLGSAVAWGTADFSGGFASKKANPIGVALVTQFIGGILLVLAAWFAKESFPMPVHLFYSGMAGIFGGLGLIAFYKGLAVGRMGIVSTLSAVLSALVPIGYTAVFEGFPPWTKIFGFICVMVAVFLFCLNKKELGATKFEFGMSAVTGMGFGLFFILIDRANDVQLLYPLAIARFTTVILLFFMVLVTNVKVVRPIEGQWPFLLATSVLDASANGLFSYATFLGRLDIAVVLGSLYPASTVTLAAIFLKESLGRRQWLGVCFMFTALILIST